jgi:hypothetical protein
MKGLQLKVRVSEEQLAQIDACAREAGLTRSAWVLLAATSSRTPSAELRAELAAARAEVRRLQREVAASLRLVREAGDRLATIPPE